MNKPIRSDVALEKAMQAFLPAIRVPKFANACRILFVNGDCLTLSPELEQVGIVALEGLPATNINGADLTIANSQIRLTSLAQEVIPKLLPQFTKMFASASIAAASIKDENVRQSTITASIVQTASNQDATNQFAASLLPYLGGAIKPIAELVIGGLYKFYAARYESQRQFIPEFDDVVASLRRLSLLSSFLTLAICPHCNNYELVFSGSAKINLKCPKCGFDWSVLTVNELPQTVASLIGKNKGLPVFISSYLRSKSLLPVEIFPNAEYNIEGNIFEMDVVIPSTLTGIECKCYANNLAVTSSTLKSVTGNIKKQVMNYKALGLKRVFIVTNYCDADANQINLALKKQLKNANDIECRVLSSDMAAFIRFLDEESSRINDNLNQNVTAQIEAQLHAPAGQIASSN